MWVKCGHIWYIFCDSDTPERQILKFSLLLCVLTFGTFKLGAIVATKKQIWIIYIHLESESFMVQNNSGLLGEYYNTSNLMGDRVISRIDPQVKFYIGTGSHGSGVNSDNFSVRWRGFVLPTVTGRYTFYTKSDDGVRLWINDGLIIDNWTDHAETENSGQIDLESGKSYNIRLEYYEKTVNSTIELSWQPPGGEKQTISANNLAIISLSNTTTTIAENSSTTNRIKVADINIDALGTETITLTGADAASFEVNGNILYLKAGTVLNYEAKSSYAVTVNVDDTTLDLSLIHI